MSPTPASIRAPRAVLSAGRPRTARAVAPVGPAGDDRLVRGAGRRHQGGGRRPGVSRHRRFADDHRLSATRCHRRRRAGGHQPWRGRRAAAGGGRVRGRAHFRRDGRVRPVAARHRRQPGLRRPRHRAAARAHDRAARAVALHVSARRPATDRAGRPFGRAGGRAGGRHEVARRRPAARHALGAERSGDPEALGLGRARTGGLRLPVCADGQLGATAHPGVALCTN
jgi:hypothetical protein